MEQELPIYGDGMNIRDWLFVEDHCQAIERVLADGRPGETYNIGGDAERTNIDVVRTICRLLDIRRPRRSGLYEELVRFVPDRPGHDRRYAIDAGKIRNELGWRPAHDFEAGISRTVDWYLTHQAWVSRILDGGYRMERLGT